MKGALLGSKVLLEGSRHGRGGSTVWHESDIFTPYNRYVGVFTTTLEADANLFHGSVAAKKLFLVVAE